MKNRVSMNTKATETKKWGGWGNTWIEKAIQIDGKTKIYYCDQRRITSLGFCVSEFDVSLCVCDVRACGK